jgi:hypothetical protein
MPELDPFEIRVAAAVHAIADRADTRVDAAAVARESVGQRPVWSVAWSWLQVPLPATMLLVLALTLALVVGVALVGALRDRPSLLAPLPTPTGEMSAAPSPTGDGTGVAHVTGSGTFSIVSPGTTAEVGDGTQIRGYVATSAVVANDPRATGTGTLHLDIDTHGRVGSEWGTYRLETADGAWEGDLGGGSWSDGNASDVVGYLVGSGDYEGYSLYVDVRSSGSAMELEGIIFPGPPPGP